MNTDNVYAAVRYVPFMSSIIGVGLRDVVSDRHSFHAEAVYLSQGVASTHLCHGTIDCPDSTLNVVINDLFYKPNVLQATQTVMTDDPWGWFYEYLFGPGIRDSLFLPTHYLPQGMVLDVVPRADLTDPQHRDVAFDRVFTIWIIDHDETTATMVFCRWSTSTTLTLPLGYAGQVPNAQFLLENLDLLMAEAVLHGIGDVHRGGGS